ncbi:MAG: hypothetical protein ACRDMZ_13430 [Solirubrobacteraceae bacterium]
MALLGERSPADATRALAMGHAISERQARRYVQGALGRPEGVAVPERTAVFTVKLPVDVIAALRRHVRLSGQTLSATVAEAVRAHLDHAHERRGGKAR